MADSRRMRRRAETTASSVAKLVEHLDDTTVVTRDLQLVKMFEAAGLDPHPVSEETLAGRYGVIAEAIKNLDCRDLTLKVYVVKRRVRAPRDQVARVATLRMTERYHDALGARGMFALQIFIAVEKNARGFGAGPLRYMRLSDFDGHFTEVEAARAELESFARRLQGALEAFGLRPLGIRKNGSRPVSEIATFFNFLLEVRHRDIESGSGPLASRMGMGRIVYPEMDHIEFRLPSEIVHGAMLGVSEYPDTLAADALLPLLWTPAEFVTCAAWRYVSREFALEQVRRQRRKLLAAEDDARSQVHEIAGMLDDAVAGRTLLGRAWFSVLALGRGTDSRAATTSLNGAVAAVERAMNQSGFALVREDLAIACAHWAMFPAGWRYAVRVVTLTNRNFAALAHLQNAARGPRSTPWGLPLAHLETPYGVPYRMTLHAGEVGNTFVAGPSGSGKTVLLGWIAAHAHGAGANVVFFDKDRGAELAVSGLGGRYVGFRAGEATGINPFRGTADRTFLRHLCQFLLRRHAISDQESNEVAAALRAVQSVPAAHRRLSLVADALDPDGDLFRGMRKWVRDGEYAWIFDNISDELAFSSVPGLYGFDIAPFLDDPEIRTPVLHYLFHRVTRLLDGAPTLLVIDEFWRVLDDSLFASYLRDHLATIRKRNGAVLLATQSLADVLQSEHARTVVEQAPTRLLFANPAARPEDYAEGFGMGARAGEIVRNLPARSFLFQRGEETGVCRLDLQGLDDVIALLSGRTELLRRYDRLCVSEPELSRAAAALRAVSPGGTDA